MTVVSRDLMRFFCSIEKIRLTQKLTYFVCFDGSLRKRARCVEIEDIDYLGN